MSLHVTIAIHSYMEHQIQWANLIEKGLSCHQIRVNRITAGEHSDTDVVIAWGWRSGKIYKERGHKVLVAERGYVGDRFLWTSLGWGGLNGYATFVIPDDKGERWERHFAQNIKPWRRFEEGLILVTAQVPGDQSVAHAPGGYLNWLTSILSSLRGLYGAVAVRPHPKAPRLSGKFPQTTGTLDQDLRTARAVVTFNSNSSVDAVLAGIPTVTLDKGSMAYSVSSHSIEEIGWTPKRQTWADRIAWTQYLPTELADGFAWDVVKGNLECPTSTVKT